MTVPGSNDDVHDSNDDHHIEAHDDDKWRDMYPFGIYGFIRLKGCKQQHIFL